jgi:transglutaminase-like putative cysteine protease
VGLVYTQSNGQAGFAYHMWNELYVDGQWIAYDATLGLGGIGGGHIKLSDSHLAEGTALASFLPVVQVMGRLRIEVVAVDAP